jgi:hypothetical protein
MVENQLASGRYSITYIHMIKIILKLIWDTYDQGRIQDEEWGTKAKKKKGRGGPEFFLKKYSLIFFFFFGIGGGTMATPGLPPNPSLLMIVTQLLFRQQ